MLKDFESFGIKLSTDQFSEIFDSYWDGMGRSFKKLETLQRYAGDDGLVSPFLAGRKEEFVKWLLCFKQDESSPMAQAFSRGISLERLHIVSFPLTDYIQAEYYSYICSSALGEQIKFINSGSLPRDDMFDYLLFDDNHLLVQDYTPDGELVGAYNITDSGTIRDLTVQYDQWYAQAQDFRRMLTPDIDIIRRLM